MKTRRDLSELYRFFYENKFSLDSEYGFIDVEDNTNLARATYIEMEKTHQDYIDPLGERHEQTLVTYNVFEFKIEPLEKEIFLLSITNPPKSIKKFVDRISSSFQYDITFSAVDLQLNEVIKKLDSNQDINLLRINKLKASGLKLNDDSTACIEIVSKGNALQEIEIYANGSKYSIDKFKGSMIFKDEKLSFEISKSGIVSINNDDFDLDNLTNVVFL
jgi:hypothetical protein